MEQSLNRPSRLYLPIHSQTPGSRGKRTALEGLYAIVRSELRGKHKSYHCQHGILPRLLLPLKIYEIYATADQQIPSLVVECCPCSSTVGLYTATRMPQLPFYCIREQGRSGGFDSCDWLSNLTPIGFKSSIFSLCDLEIWWMTYKNNRAPLLYYVKLCASFHIHWWIQTGVTVRKRPIRVKISDFFVPCDLKISWMTLENNRAPLLYLINLCPSFQSHQGIQTWVTVRKSSIRVKIGDFFVPCDLEIWWMTLKKLGSTWCFVLPGRPHMASTASCVLHYTWRATTRSFSGISVRRQEFHSPSCGTVCIRN